MNYWIGNFSSGKDDENAIDCTFLVSAESKQPYAEDFSGSTFINISIKTF